MRTMKRLKLTSAQRDVLGRLEDRFVIREVLFEGHGKYKGILSYDIILFSLDDGSIEVVKRLNRLTVLKLLEEWLIDEIAVSPAYHLRPLSGKWYGLSAKGERFIKGMWCE